MNNEILKKINEELSFDELSDIVKTALSAIYRKLRTDEGFDYDQHCSVISIGSNETDVKAFISDVYSCNTGTDWSHVFWL